MRRLCLCMWTILALLILVTSGSGQERYKATSSSWLPRFLQFKRPPQPQKAAAKTEPKAQPQVAAASMSPVMMMNPKSADALRRAEKEKWERRVKVCDELRAIAFQTGDNDLQRKAEYLDQRAFETYMSRTGQSQPLESAVAVQSDNDMIAQFLRSEKARQNPNFAPPSVEQRIRANVEEQP